MNTISSSTKSINSKSSLKNKLKAKFGNKFSKAEKLNKLKELEKVEVSKKSKKLANSESSFGDVKDNNPQSDLTQAKLKGLIRSGGFQFNDKEREALSKILDV